MSKEVYGKLEAVHQCEAHLDVIEYLGLVRRLCITSNIDALYCRLCRKTNTPVRI